MSSTQRPSESLYDGIPARSTEHPGRDLISTWDWALRWLPALLIAAITAFSLVRSGVGIREILVFSTYWNLTLLLPGTLVVRLVFARERNLPGYT